MEPPRAGTSNELESHSNLAAEPPKKKSDDLDFYCNFARLPLITKEVYDMICSRDGRIRELLPRELLEYYVTALLWARLLHIKRCSSPPLTAIEDHYLYKFVGKLLFLPEPIYNILTMIGHVRDFPAGTGRILYLSNHRLPVAKSGGRGGYHYQLITGNNHNFFEELPSLGVSADCVLFLVRPRNSTEPTFPVLPVGAEATPNMAGYFGPPGPITAGVSSVLASLSVSAGGFKEDVASTRLNMGFIDYVSDIIPRSTAFRAMHFHIDQMSVYGSQTQVIETLPVARTELMHHGLNPAIPSCTQRIVQAERMPFFDEECVKASYVTGFQLYKEGVEGDHSNWCCLRSHDSSNTWTLGKPFTRNKNHRRLRIRQLLEDHGPRGGMWSQADMTQEYCEKHHVLNNP